MAKNTALNVPPFYGACGTSSQCVPINTPGAESTNNLTRGRRLGPRWQGQREGNTQRERPGVLLEIPSPPKSVTETPSPRHEFTAQDDAALIDRAPLSGLVVTMPLRTEAHDSSQGDLRQSAVVPETNKQSRMRLYTCLALATLIVFIVLAGIAWQSRAKHTVSSMAAIANRPTALANAPPVIVPLNGEHVQGTIAADEAPSHADKADAPAGRAPQSRVTEQENQVRVSNTKKTIASRESTSTVATAKAKAGNNADTSVDLANEYLRSEGVPRGCEKALPLLKTAAATGNVRACNRLASMYAIGSCVQRDPLQAYRWVSAALDADPRNHWAQQNRDLILHQMTAGERSQIRSTE